jgi:NAD(P)-dependent dehydrogenase (short-subunit alcohol dehydrogenase family)
MPADVGDVSATEQLVTRIIQEFGQLDVLVNNAGLIRASPFGKVLPQEWDLTFGVNVRGLFFLMQASAREMLTRRSGAIVNIASIAGRGAPTLSPAYAASKAAVINLTQSAARALALSGIRVNAVCPGIIDTAFNWRLDHELGVESQGLEPGEFLRRRVSTVPMGRIGQPAEVATVVSFLASAQASYVTGQAINIDGGILAN